LSILRFIRLFALSMWLGSFFFFAAVVAPAAFQVLPSRTMAGQIVSHSLYGLHWIGITCGLLFLLAGVLMALFGGGHSPLQLRDLLIVLMMGITLTAHFGIERKMETLRDQMGMVENVPHDDPRRVEFNRMHVWSTRMEGSVFVIGAVLMFLMAKEQQRER
jgi:hypothetical protein